MKVYYNRQLTDKIDEDSKEEFFALKKQKTQYSTCKDSHNRDITKFQPTGLDLQIRTKR